MKATLEQLIEGANSFSESLITLMCFHNGKSLSELFSPDTNSQQIKMLMALCETLFLNTARIYKNPGCLHVGIILFSCVRD